MFGAGSEPPKQEQKQPDAAPATVASAAPSGGFDDLFGAGAGANADAPATSATTASKPQDSPAQPSASFDDMFANLPKREENEDKNLEISNQFDMMNLGNKDTKPQQQNQQPSSENTFGFNDNFLDDTMMTTQNQQ